MVDKSKERKDKLLKEVPTLFWNRFVGKCKTKGLTIVQGLMEAGNEWIEKD